MLAILVTGHYYYKGLAVSSPAVTETIARTHRTYPRRDGQAEWAWMVHPQKVVTNRSTN